jgi:16S rRNA (adenine1518-N6/adenine1519-N6)-dimethyltransferase
VPTPRKRFGQHFLCDQAIIHRIIAALAPKKNEHLVEIGPGQGALTLGVLKQVGYLEVVELDRDLVPQLEARSRGLGHLQIYEADALEFDFASLKQDDRPLRIFGNLPYNISTPLIFHLLTFAPQVADMLFMLQKEVALRLAACAGSDDYGRLSVMVQYCCQVELLFDVPPTAFYPPPKVQSSIVRLLPYRTYPYRANNEALFASIVKQAFGQRRKTLRNSLKGLVDDNVWAHIGIKSDLRAENLSVQQFVEITNACQPTP